MGESMSEKFFPLIRDVLKAIRKVESAWKKINGTKFGLVNYKDANGELRPCYSLTKNGVPVCGCDIKILN